MEHRRRIEQPAFTSCLNCGTANHAGYSCPCDCHFDLDELLCAMAGVCIAMGAGLAIWFALLAAATLAGVTP